MKTRATALHYSITPPSALEPELTFVRRRLRLRFEAKNSLGFFHHIEPVPRHDFDVTGIVFERIDLARLQVELGLLFSDLQLQLLAPLREFALLFEQRQKRADDSRDERERDQHDHQPIEK